MSRRTVKPAAKPAATAEPTETFAGVSQEEPQEAVQEVGQEATQEATLDFEFNPSDVVTSNSAKYYSPNKLYAVFEDSANVEAMILYFDTYKDNYYQATKQDVTPLALLVKYKNKPTPSVLDYNQLLEKYPNIGYVAVSGASRCKGNLKAILIDGQLSEYQGNQYHKTQPMNAPKNQSALGKYRDIRTKALEEAGITVNINDSSKFDNLSNFL